MPQRFWRWLRSGLSDSLRDTAPEDGGHIGIELRVPPCAVSGEGNEEDASEVIA